MYIPAVDFQNAILFEYPQVAREGKIGLYNDIVIKVPLQ